MTTVIVRASAGRVFHLADSTNQDNTRCGKALKFTWIEREPVLLSSDRTNDYPIHICRKCGTYAEFEAINERNRSALQRKM